MFDLKKISSILLRFRNIYLFFVTIGVVVLLFLTDPDNKIIQGFSYGAGVLASLILLLKAVVYVTLLHFTRKAMFDYIDMGDLYDIITSKKDPVGAGLYAIAVSIATLAFALLIFAAVAF